MIWFLSSETLTVQPQKMSSDQSWFLTKIYSNESSRRLVFTVCLKIDLSYNLSIYMKSWSCPHNPDSPIRWTTDSLLLWNAHQKGRKKGIWQNTGNATTEHSRRRWCWKQSNARRPLQNVPVTTVSICARSDTWKCLRKIVSLNRREVSQLMFKDKTLLINSGCWKRNECCVGMWC